MCLNRVTSDTGPDGFGWKMFDVYGGKLFCPYFRDLDHPLPVGEWITDQNDIEVYTAQYDSRYRVGFHIYSELTEFVKKSADSWRYIIRKVEYRNVVAVGIQDDEKVIVAREMKICV